ncbi:DUF6279 family lipoprotein [Halopseudomonas salegens]|uniref:Lipoprotein n=1 Tax=Halopseudomonas salegens TaxID=1434072 RepID=A0A1H2G518_9GAMM|nr:DUF6279 family lipoprotein [Halopseudomonas salegens]SDU14687.1 hypothetical protein SAMN05216210_2046 [Halopseudomonas salegens]
MPLTRSCLRLLAFSLLVLTLLSACSTTRLGYAHLPWLVSWKSREYVPLNRDQRSWLREQIAEHRDWHCRQELPRYPALLDELADPLLSNPPQGRQLLAARDKIEPALDRLLGALAPSLAELLQQLDETQVAALRHNLEQQHGELYDTYVAPDAATQAAERQQRLEKRLRPWLGRLQADQQQRISEWSAQLEGQNAIWLENRSYWLQAFNAALDQRDQTDFALHVERLLTDRKSYWTETFQRRTEINSQLAADMLSDVVALNSPGQDDRLRQRLDRLKADIAHIDCNTEAAVN